MRSSHCMCTLLALFPHNFGAVRQMQSLCARYLLCFLTTLVLWDKCSHCVCTLFTLFPHSVGAVEWSCLCMYTLFVPSWCCQINQSLYVHVICYVLSQRWCCQINQSLYVHVICYVLSQRWCCQINQSLYVQSAVLSQRLEAVSICTARGLFFTTVWIAGGHWWATRVVKLGNQHSNGRPRIRF